MRQKKAEAAEAGGVNREPTWSRCCSESVDLLEEPAPVRSLQARGSPFDVDEPGSIKSSDLPNIRSLPRDVYSGCSKQEF